MTREEWLIQRSIKKAAEETGLHPDTIQQVIQHESSGRPDAQSPTGPQGLMQLGKAAAIEGGIDPSQRFDIQKNVAAGANYYKQQVDKFGDKAYAAYHDGPTAVANGEPISKEGQWAPTPPPKEEGMTRAEWLANRSKSVSEVGNAIKDAAYAGMEHLPGSNVIPTMFGKEMAAYKRGPSAYQRFKEAQDIPSFAPQDAIGAIPLLGPAMGVAAKKIFDLPDSSFAISAGQELDKLYTGARKFGNTLSAMTGISDYDTAVAKNHALDLDRLEKDKLLQEFNDTGGFNLKGFSKVAGSTLPYLIDGALLGPGLAKGSEKVVSKIASTPIEAINEGKGLITKGVEHLAKMNQPVAKPLRWFGQRAKLELTDPWALRALGKSRQVEGMTPLSRGLGTTLGAGILGAIEGGLHPDQTAAGGAISSLAGDLSGKAVAPFLTRATNYRDKFPDEKRLLEWYESQGGRLSPGEKLGDKAHQMFESGMDNSPSFTNAIGQFKDANRIIDNRIAWEALGVPRGRVDTMSAKELNDYLADIGKQYDEIQKSTIGQFAPNDRQDLLAHIGNLKKDGTNEGRAIYNDAMDYKLRMDKLMAPNRNALGQTIPSTVTGTDFKELRSRLKSDISDYYKNGKKSNAEALKPFVKTLDDAVERAMGPEQLVKWKDLNLKNALANDVLDNGLNEMLRFNPGKYGKHLMSEDAKRFLTENENAGPALNQLYKLAKVDFIKSNKAGSSLSGMGVNGFGDKQSIMTRLLSNTPPILSGPVNLGLRLYMSGIPVETGLLNMSGKNLGNPALYTRAYQASQQSWPHLYNDVVGLPKTLQEMFKDQEDQKDDKKR